MMMTIHTINTHTHKPNLLLNIIKKSESQRKFILGDGGGRVGEHYNCLNCNVCFNDQMVTLKHARFVKIEIFIIKS